MLHRIASQYITDTYVCFNVLTMSLVIGAVAHRAYLQSYQHLSDLRYTDTNLQELRIAAAIIMYKVK